MSDMYILGDDGRTPVVCDDPLEWGRWHHDNADKCRVGLDRAGAAYVSTRFVGHSDVFSALFPDRPPLLFETITFDAGGEIAAQVRAYTWEQAEKLHASAVANMRRMVNG